MRLVIIGADAAGMSAASQAKRLDPSIDVIVLEQTTDVSYGACGLPYKLPDGHDMEDLRAITVEEFRCKRNIDVRLQHEVERIDPEEHTVFGTSSAAGPFELQYDRLVIATGARVSRPPIPGLDELWGQGAYALKTLQDGRLLKTALRQDPQSVVIVGGGYIGLEAAEGFHQQGLDVTIVEALPDILDFLPEKLRARVYAEAEMKQVPIHLGTRVERLERTSGGKIAVHTSAADVLKTDLVLISTGVRPNSEIAAQAGLQLGAHGSIAVDDYLFTSAPDILAAGDCADATHGISNQSVWIPLALRANRAGKLAGGNALGQRSPAPPVMGSAIFRFFDLEIARTGLSAEEAAEAEFDAVATAIDAPTRARYIPGGGQLSVWLLADKGSHRLLGGAMVGPESAAHRIDTVVAALHAGQTVEQLYAMDLSYQPCFGPSWSPLLTCASQLMKKLE
ncbi:MAG: FAD-dependent oxidoreductase [Gammaproteobacteria bacterium]|jgi:NADPH-dependent 2,4-dienoyl-CoA reductase/sulfur reductase-like enzyme